ncbi:MAG: hypothetical protein Kow0022_03000 [Phycisphaerales bacterium]
MSHSLNDRQREAVEYQGGSLLVLAGPGTGKTRIIVHRVAHMIQNRGIEPERIAALTFTNKAADELRDRLGKIVGPSAAEAMYAGTFHRFGLLLLRRFADLAGLPPTPQILDSAQQRRLVRSLVLEHGLFAHAMGSGMDSVVADGLRAISEMCNAGLEPAQARARLDELLADPSLEVGPRAELQRFSDHVRLFELFEHACRRRGLISIDELITRPTRLLREHQLVREICRHDYAHVVVDEFQDLNPAQILLLKHLCGPGDPDLCAVGDDDQAIYAFRGADEFAFQRFAEFWPNARRVMLTENWRSGPAVVEWANAVIAQSNSRFAPDKVIEVPAERRRADSRVEFVDCADAAEAHDAIASMILLDRNEHPERPYSDYAVLARTNTEVERVASALEFEGIPVLVLRNADLSSDEGVQDLLAWVSVVLEPDQTWAVRRLLTRPPFGVDPLVLGRVERARRAEESRLPPGEHMPAVVEWLCERFADDASVAPHALRLRDLARGFAASAASESADRTIYRIITEAGLAHADLPGQRARARRIEALVTVLRFVRERLPRLEQPRDLAAFWRYYNDLDSNEQRFASLVGEKVNGPEQDGIGDADGVRVFTAHASKGLEFDTVFLPQCHPPYGFPKTRHDDCPVTPDAIISDRPKPEVLEEERRVFYVACTRAKRRLVMLGKTPKGRPAPTHLALPLVQMGLAPRIEAEDVFARAAERGLGRSAQRKETSEIDREREMSRRAVLARARQRARLEASLALDSADRAGLDADQLSQIAQRLEESARQLAFIAAIEHGRSCDDAVRPRGDVAEALLAELAELSDPANQAFFQAPKPPLFLSYTSIHDYLRCPRCYYVKHVLRLDEPTGPALRVGIVVHETLQAFYEAWGQADSEGSPTPGLDELLSIGRTRFAHAHEPDDLIDRGELEQVMAQLRTMYEKFHDDRIHPLELEKRVELPYRRGEHTHYLTAKLDRIDQTDAGLRIVDYKTGRASQKLLKPGKADLQLGIYAIALEHLYGADALTGTAEYWLLADGRVGSINLDEIDRAKIMETINGVIDGILAGNFEQSKECRDAGDWTCSIFDAVSRRDEVRPDEAGV